MIRSYRYFGVLVVGLFLSLQVGSEISLMKQWHLIGSLFTRQTELSEYASILFVESRLPRLTMALLVGGVLGLAGSVMQQLTQNPLVSPLTLGSASGAWLALVICNIFFPVLVNDFSTIFALSGAIMTLLLVVLIAGVRNLSGLPVVLAGMAVNILLGAIATAIVLLNDQYAKNLFIWGAGDLAQNGWDQVVWLLPNIAPALFVFVFAPRVLMLLRLGQTNATARGLNIAPMFFALLCLALWLVSAAISVVGVISFIGLLAPNFARQFGASKPRNELVLSTLLGALLLVFTDTLAIWLSSISLEIVPSGIATAFIGAPALIYFSRKKLNAQDNISLSQPKTHLVFTHSTISILTFVFCMVLFVSVFLARQVVDDSTVWVMKIPTEFGWQLRWPRMVTSIAAGAGIGVSGVLLQRLIYNPLASPDILGISAGATFSLVVGSLFFGVNIFDAAPLTAFLGCLVVLAILILLGKRHNYVPSMMVLSGIALTALIEALVQFSLVRGNEDSYIILSWLAGSTYRVPPYSALFLAVVVALLIGAVCVMQRWLTLISAGRAFAQSRGVEVEKVFIILLCCVALLCGVVTSVMGPVAFVGLLAPHIAVMLGAKKAGQQIITAASTGATLMLFSDWLGQNIVYPSQIAAGTIVSIIGGVYFILLLIKGRLKS
ncbi:Fe(3+)-hydroxamate ABC transporter permease FhuB [Vibrio algarum]|uniref:Fe(3+)-hydroxamate ABC transporter permease FhuB n=1 Tax=Vibrio algarum TaxID=3020714 RepID=A0ABT4YVU6_9VIBR|nr:Fe(3+)-hydroxamate ABC transporter permease FhuB [Vibrio sp. KJ40-1]MDB1125708.1 Fe(3+)-hydroxamate ABC transporter permease FhuB [Vibrio sp. KJ40-1]